MKKSLTQVTKIFIIIIILTGVIYPLIVSGISLLFFKYEATGSILEGAGSKLIAISLDSNIYFIPRPSASSYNTVPSGASNLSPDSKQIKAFSDSMKTAYRKFNLLDNKSEIPPDAISTSGSGLDNDISPANAYLQAERIAKARGFDGSKKKKLYDLILSQIETFIIFGEQRVNVLKLNIELNKL